ncbi:MAG: photosynthetic complex putative assembly protein PuhB [Tardiphaga sp.]
MKHAVSQFRDSQFKDSRPDTSLGTLPGPLPAGERLIWQGKPSVRGLALRAFHVRELPLYFGAFLAWRLWTLQASGAPLADYAWALLWIAVPALISALVLTGLAWLFARASTYTVTNKRVLLQFGVALPVTMNIPLGKIAGAALKTYRDGSGDIPLKLANERVSHLLLWPHVRPWKLIVSEPMLRAVPDVAVAAAKLAQVLSDLPGPHAVAAAASPTRPAPDGISGSAVAA